jgi:hypothetical protein
MSIEIRLGLGGARYARRTISRDDALSMAKSQ